MMKRGKSKSLMEKMLTHCLRTTLKQLFQNGLIRYIDGIDLSKTFTKFHIFKIDEVLNKDSAEEIEKGNNPGPMTEIQFWKAKCENLESLYEQV